MSTVVIRRCSSAFVVRYSLFVVLRSLDLSRQALACLGESWMLATCVTQVARRTAHSRCNSREPAGLSQDHSTCSSTVETLAPGSCAGPALRPRFGPNAQEVANTSWHPPAVSTQAHNVPLELAWIAPLLKPADYQAQAVANAHQSYADKGASSTAPTFNS